MPAIERPDRRDGRPSGEQQQHDRDDHLDLRQRVLDDARVETRRHRLDAVTELTQRRGIAGEGVAIALEAGRDPIQPRVEALQARVDAPDGIGRA